MTRVALAAFAVFLASEAMAHDPVTWPVQHAEFQASARNEDRRHAEICFARVDRRPVEELAPCIKNVPPGALVSADLRLPITYGDTAMIRGYATVRGTRSKWSRNYALVPMPPVAPENDVVSQRPRARRQRPK